MGFRLSETPCFFPRETLDRMAADGAELIRQLMEPAYLRESDRSLPERYTVPNQSERPLFTQADFGLLRGADGEIDWRLVEIQGFPSLYAFQPALARAYIDAYALDTDLRYLLGGLDTCGYREALRRAILGDADPAETVLLKVDPLRQKTLCDFRLTERICGVRPVCVTRVTREGNRLFHEGAPIRRIYNRAIADEIERRGIRLPFDFRDDLDVEWAGHPNWYFRISKFSLPFLRHRTVPRTLFLDEVGELPERLDDWVLKPLYSFAGSGVVLRPSRERIAAIEDRANYILQERVDFTPLVETPYGADKIEVRVMYLWPDEGDLRAVCTIVRTGRGKMMGVDHNKDMEWVGASAALYEP